VDELARPLALIADDRRPRLEAIQPAEVVATEDRIGARGSDPGLPGEDVRADPQLTPPSTQRVDELGPMSPGGIAWRTRAIDELASLRSVPPLRSGLATDPGGSGLFRDRPACPDPIG
jgi:hypothetical protein